VDARRPRSTHVTGIRTESNEKPWVIVAADVPLAPATHGNRVRNVQLVSALRAAGFRVLYLYWERNPREGDVESMRSRVDELAVVPARPPRAARRWTRWRRGVAAVLGRRRLLSEAAWWRLVSERNAEALCPRALIEKLELELASRPVVGLIASYANLWPLARAARRHDVLSVIDTHDVMHERAATLREQRIRPTGLLVPRDVEAQWLSEADLVLAIQAREAAVLGTLVGLERVRCIGHGVDLPELTPNADDDRPRVVMLGSNNRPNQHGLEWFRSEAWPRVLRDVPEAELLVFGPLSRTAACTGPRVKAMGEVDDVRTAQESARVALNPVRAGSGLKIKSVDALAWGRALVTTSVGAEGLEAGAGRAFLVADDAAAFAEHTVRLLRDPAAAREWGERARAFARAQFAPDVVYAPLVAALRARARLSAP